MSNDEFWEWMNTGAADYKIISHDYDRVNIVFVLTERVEDGEVSDEKAI